MATINTTGAAAASSQPAGSQTYRGPFAIMTILFFMWGFMTVFNDVLIPRFKEAFTLTYFQAMLVQFAFFGAYGIGSLIYYIISMTSGDPINRIGYKNGVIIGLLISALGSVLFYPAAVQTSYPFFLMAFFIVGLGLAMLQIAANPYVTILGPESTASSRLNLSQAFNSFGTTIGPIIGGWLIFTLLSKQTEHGAASVKIPYLCFAGVFVLLAIFFKFAHLPSFTNTEKIEQGLGALKHPHTALGMLAIFMYVGGEVTMGSLIISYLGLPALGGLQKDVASKFLAFFWGGLMIGRFMGAFALSDIRGAVKNTLVVLVPAVAFLLMALWPQIAGFLSGVPVFNAYFDPSAVATVNLVCNWHNVAIYGGFLGVLLIAFFLGSGGAHRMLALFSIVIIALLLVSMSSKGDAAKWSILGVGMFCSVMWSNIFSLAIEGLGPQKSQASSLLVMAILGGAVLPPLQGWIADHKGIQASFVIPMIAFAYIAFYGIYGYRAGRTSTAS
ncbi:MAG TPA: sugar MFS transporter [Verrucomicrobiae bacterium]|jgi:FHS family L-fucose permease-like MFS transporter